LRDVAAGTTVRVSLDSAAVPGNGDSGAARISSDGRFVAFASVATNLVSNDTNGVRDVFLRDLQTGQTTRVSVASDGTQGNADSGGTGLLALRVLDVSDDGRFVVFQSDASNLVAGDTNGVTDVFRHDNQTGVTTRVSVATGDGQADGRSINPKVSGDGRFVVFGSLATNLDTRDQNGLADVFLHDTQTGTTQAVSLNIVVTNTGNGASQNPDISGDGRLIVFSSDATDLVVGATAGIRNIFSATNPLLP
ncbi:hypothetical protein DYH09_22015, partial [bacterium CPR1]|nr:hypothetical protein [bacterium CPR1]